MPRTHTPEDVVAPNPADLIESLRDFGYTLHSALADLIDNSITAKASRITTVLEPKTPAPHVAVLDNGIGMSEETLVEAMRMGTTGPSARRQVTDLGRFGLGMKTASLSQGRCLTVISKHHNQLSHRCWDLKHVRAVRQWSLRRDLTPTATAFAATIDAQKSGTAVVIEDLDRVAFSNWRHPNAGQFLRSALEAVRAHLGMVFHRFIQEDRLALLLGEAAIPAWDPFLLAQSTPLPKERLGLPTHDGEILASPFVLPHHSKLTDDAHSVAAGPNGWNAHQGFYVYRCRRLIVPGTWLNLRLKKEEHFKLARIQLDLLNTMDNAWHLNVIKSHVSAPALLLDDFKRIATDSRRQAAEVYRFRGEREASNERKPETFVWRRAQGRTGVRFSIDRTHPVIAAMLHSGCSHDSALRAAISLIETSLPISAILQEPEKSLEGMPVSPSSEMLVELAKVASEAIQHWVRTGKSITQARDIVLGAEPFCRLRDAITRLIDEERKA